MIVTTGTGSEGTSSKGGERRRPQDIPAVGVMIKATVLDAPFLDVMVRHMIGQARYPFAERALVVDRPNVFAGKYATRPRPSLKELDRVFDGLLRDGVVDNVREVDLAPDAVERITERYFIPSDRPVPTHAATGGPVYATLFGLESMSTDYVLQMDADVLFHTGQASWVRRALECMAADDNLWLMMTHPGPPAGPAGRSLGSRHRGRAMWDARLALWRFRHATTRYFLCDRRALRHRLPFVQSGGGVAPLEQCISHALEQHGAFRGNLGDLQSWHLHVWHHGHPFPEWAPAMVRAVEAGLFPASQRGRYDVRLDRAGDRDQWARVLGSLDRHTSDVEHPAPSTGRTRGALPPGSAPITVVIPVRDRAGRRLRHALRSLQWRSAGPPAEVLVVSHGSRPEIDAELESLCRDEGATLIIVGRATEPWNKSFALNTGIRRSTPNAPFLMTMDVDMVLSPHFLSVVIEQLSKDSPALVLCRISDLPPHTLVPADREELSTRFERLRRVARLRARSGSGGIQAASRSFFFAIRGYDEDLTWWGAMDGDLVKRAHLMGLTVAWIDHRVAMLHQWHPRKYAVLTRSDHIRQARRAWRRNHLLVRSRGHLIQRNPEGWGGEQDDRASVVARR